jgi:hypothetical protein
MSAPEFRLSASGFPDFRKSHAICGTVCGAPREAFSSSVFPDFLGRADDDVEQLQLAAQINDGSFRDPVSFKTISHFDVWFQKRLLVFESRKQRGSKPPSEGPSLLLRSAAHFWRAPRPGF